MASARLSPDAHRAQAQKHRAVGEVLADAKNEWGAVCFFYAAYHDVKAALLEDAVFDSYEACQSFNGRLLPEDRHASAHRARVGSRQGLGVNDLVAILYRPASGTYERLHQMSIDVRYGTGLAPGAIEHLPAVNEKFVEFLRSGVLTSGIEPAP